VAREGRFPVLLSLLAFAFFESLFITNKLRRIAETLFV
jgi:hypothetical protein